MVTHDPEVAERADITLHLNKGSLVEASRLEGMTTGGAR
jgi:predicted ABC-type transport system involved in lysophospholipase L1 biosynthesis ATPase subunit